MEDRRSTNDDSVIVGKPKIEVTVLCFSYNQETYIAQAIEGFIKQKTTFAYEVLLIDDASTDQTSSIISQYAKLYPDIIIPVLLQTNCYTNHLNKYSYYKHLIRGQYVTFCEGDDFWTSSEKLQKQYDTLSNNPACYMCLHRVNAVAENGTPLHRFFPYNRMTSQFFSSMDFLNLMGKYGTCFRFCSFFVRAENFKEYNENIPEFRKKIDVGDGPMLLYFAQLGPVFYNNDVLAAYRTNAKNSWTSRMKRDPAKRIAHFKKWSDCIDEYNRFTSGEYTHQCYQINLFWSCKKAALEQDYEFLLNKNTLAYLSKRNGKNKFLYLLCCISPSRRMKQHLVLRMKP